MGDKGEREHPILSGESWVCFRDELDALAASTKSQYITAFSRFLDYSGYNTETLYNEHKANCDDADPRAKKRLPRKVREYENHLIGDLHKSTGTARTVEKAISKFFRANELPFRMNGGGVEVVTEEISSITKQQILKILSATGSYKIKAFFNFAKDSGLRVGDITNIPIKLLREAIDNPEIGFYTFTLRQQKTKRFADPVIGPDALNSLREWMKYRTEHEKLTAGPDDALFCIERTRRGYTNKKGRVVKATNAGEYMDESNMGILFAQLVKKADLERDINGKLPSIHSLRKYHKTNLEYNGVPTSWVNKMQGRKGAGTGGAYTKPNTEQLIDLYRKGYKGLSLSAVNHSGEISDLRKKLQDTEDWTLSNQTAFERMQSENDDLKARLSGLEEAIAKMLETKKE